MKNSKTKKLSLKKQTISNLQLKQINGGAHTSCMPTCKIKTQFLCLPTEKGLPGED